jgi:prepilin-type processing-associated H-X9-DG protein
LQVVDVELIDNGRGLDCIAANGNRRTLSAELLWAQCPSAQGRVRREKGLHHPPGGLLIRSVSAIGAYGVNIAFSDGHARGIYPWTYLAELARTLQPQDFLID